MTDPLAGRPAEHPTVRGLTAVRWALDLWWVTTRRKWREETGAPLIAAGLAFSLVLLSVRSPLPGAPLHLSILLWLGLVSIVLAPLLLTGESVLASRRVDLLPIPSRTRWLLRILLANPLRTLLTLVVACWAAAVAGLYHAGGGGLVIEIVQVCGWLFLALSLSQLLEDVIRHRRAVVLHQVLFLVGLSIWPLFLEYLRDEENFSPPPAWTRGALEPFLIGTEAGTGAELIAASVLFVTGAMLVWADQAFIRSAATRPPAPAGGPRWTAAVAGLLAWPSGGDYLLRKELLVPLRFLFLRMSIVFVLLLAAAAFLTGVPYLLLAAAFWWQPLSTNALGPDVGGGGLRYALLGWSPNGVLRRRTLAAVLFTGVAFVAAAAACAAVGRLAPATVGPASRLMYIPVALYALTLIPLSAIAGDRYSVRYPDRLELHTLLPERKRSAGAAAIALLLSMWVGIAVGAVGVGVGAYLLALSLPGLTQAGQLTAALLLAGAVNVILYSAHTKSFCPRWT